MFHIFIRVISAVVIVQTLSTGSGLMKQVCRKPSYDTYRETMMNQCTDVENINWKPSTENQKHQPVLTRGSSETQTLYIDEDHICPNGSAPSRTKPKHYPADGIGESVYISKDFDTTKFNYLCSESTAIAVLAIHSGAVEFERRTAVRQTLGRECLMRNCILFFVVGVSPNNTIHQKVKEEYIKENDILIIPKIDRYRYLANKVYATMEWVVQYCSNPKYVIHLNDDLFINIRLVYELMDKQPDVNFILGRVIKKAWPFRGERSKFYISNEEYPYQYWPPFCLGAFYAFPNAISRTLFEAIPRAEFCWLDDIWFTGLVRLAAGGIRLQEVHRRFNQYHHMSNIKASETLAREWIIKKQHIVIHRISIEEYYILYNVSMSNY